MLAVVIPEGERDLGLSLPYDRDSHRAGELERFRRMGKSLPPGTSNGLNFMKSGPAGRESLLSPF